MADNFKKEIDFLWIGDDPIGFYLTDSTNICLAHFNIKKIFGRTCYKVTKTEGIKLDNQHMKIKTYNSSAMFKNLSNTDVERIIYGVDVSINVNNIIINGIKPTVKLFENNGEEYALWYIVGGKELDNVLTFPYDREDYLSN